MNGISTGQTTLHRKVFGRFSSCFVHCFSLDLLIQLPFKFLLLCLRSTTHFSTSPLILKMTKITTHSHYTLRDAPSLLNLNQGIMSQSMGNVIRLYSLKWPLTVILKNSVNDEDIYSSHSSMKQCCKSDNRLMMIRSKCHSVTSSL